MRKQPGFCLQPDFCCCGVADSTGLFCFSVCCVTIVCLRSGSAAVYNTALPYGRDYPREVQGFLVSIPSSDRPVSENMAGVNPLLSAQGLPPFAGILPQHVAPAVDIILTFSRQILERVETDESEGWDALMLPLEQIDILFEYGWGPVEHLLSVASTDELRAAHEAVLPKIVELRLQLRQSEALYRRLLQLRSHSDITTSETRRRIVERMILSAEQSGIALQGEQQERFNEIQQQLSQLATDFSNHVLDATKMWHLDLTDAAAVAGLPESLRRLTAAAWSRSAENSGGVPAAADSGPWRLTLDQPCLGPFLEHSRERSLRELVYRAYVTRASDGALDNGPLISRILQLRREQARLLGYECYADLSLSQKMAGDVAAVQQMFDRLLLASLDRAKKELEELTALAEQQGHEGPLAHWDLAFWAERLREQRFSFTDEQLRPYFSLDRVLDGLFALCERLFGITVRSVADAVSVWDADVRYYEVLDESGVQIAGFFLDPYSRPANKRPGAWMNDCIGRSVTVRGVRLPVAHLICNSTPPAGGKPALMTFREVETLFHEFGHGLQHMLTTVNERDAAGICGVEWDAVELPSQFMESWCLHRETLMQMARHYETGEVLPEELYLKLRESRTFRAASQMLRQLQFGMIDMALHYGYDPAGGETVSEVEQRVLSITSMIPPLPENRFLCSFAHIFAGGYAAGYYSYKWAEVLSADAFRAFEEAGLEDAAAMRTAGRRFRDTVLALGGSQHPLQVFRAFRGRDPDPAALLMQCGLG